MLAISISGGKWLWEYDKAVTSYNMDLSIGMSNLSYFFPQLFIALLLLSSKSSRSLWFSGLFPRSQQHWLELRLLSAASTATNHVPGLAVLLAVFYLEVWGREFETLWAPIDGRPLFWDHWGGPYGAWERLLRFMIVRLAFVPLGPS